MYNTPDNLQDGFIALISAIIISSILMGLVISSANTGFSTRIDIMNRELKRQSKNLAESCLQNALLYLEYDYTYSPSIFGDKMYVSTDTCTIDSVTYDIENPLFHTKIANIKTHASFHNTWTHLSTKISLSSPFFAHNPTLSKLTIIKESEI